MTVIDMSLFENYFALHLQTKTNNYQIWNVQNYLLGLAIFMWAITYVGSCTHDDYI